MSNNDADCGLAITVKGMFRNTEERMTTAGLLKALNETRFCGCGWQCVCHGILQCHELKRVESSTDEEPTRLAGRVDVCAHERNGSTFAHEELAGRWDLIGGRIVDQSKPEVRGYQGSQVHRATTTC
jgi:hypothetical protein